MKGDLQFDRDKHVEELRSVGYTLVPHALPPEDLVRFRTQYEALLAPKLDVGMRASPRPRVIKLKPLLLLDKIFEELIDWPRVFPIVRSLLGADVTLAGAGEGDCRLPRTGPTTVWHTDLQWLPGLPYPRPIHMIRCSFFLDDIGPHQAPFAVIPGTHLAPEAPPERWSPNYEPIVDPSAIPGMVRITGRAGTCFISHSEIWHTSTPNETDICRKMIQLIYKHAWMRPWVGPDNEIPEAFAASRPTPLRRQLCGEGVWHRTDGAWDS